MEWTNEQEGALAAVSQWFRGGGSEPFYLAGYAGTGKTTLARHFAESVGGEVKFGAFTGKAASVLRKKGCPGATTIHSLIYKPVGNSNGKKISDLEILIENMLALPEAQHDQALLRSWGQELQALKAKSSAMFEVNEDAEITEADLVILDECSMIDQRMGADLQKFGVPILYLGDPGQLPPVGGRGLLADKRPDYVLEEIHRQARDSAIIWAAHEIRHGRKVGLGTFGNGEVEVFRKGDFDWDLAINADQILCGMNGTRRKLNKAARSKLGRTKLYPVEGDKMICLQNDHDEGLLNGVTCVSLKEGTKRGQVITLDMEYDEEHKRLLCDPGHFEENYQTRISFPRRDSVQHFDYGYAITGHKSQGSQWGHVVICDDKMRAEDEMMRRKWLYTVVTRAESRLTVYA